jgi:pimeloyl-ACP methyl ester carboxylesterase
VVAGNSLGGFTALYAAASEAATKGKGLINGAILLNAAGRFKETSPVEAVDTRPQWIQSYAENFKKLVIRFSFIYTKQPQRIKQVLTQVYPVDAANVDDELVESIQFPAQNPNAPEVFYRVIAKNGNGPPVFVDDLLKTLKVPLLLLWGEKDPWIRPQAADMMEKLYPSAQRVNINAGHCPHDEAPEACNTAMKNFMKSVNS